MGPRTRGMWAEPCRSRPVAVLAGDAFGNLKRAAPLLRSGIKRVTRQTLRGLLRLCAQFQDARHPFADVPRERLIGSAVLVLKNPGRVLVLQNAAACNGLDASVAARRRARSGTDVFDGLFLLGAHQRGRQER